MNPQDKQRIEAAAQRNAMRMLRATWVLDEMGLVAEEGTMQMTELRVRFPIEQGGEYMAICKATADGRRFVGFHTASSSAECIAGAVERVKANTMKWREDHPYVPPEER